MAFGCSPSVPQRFYAEFWNGCAEYGLQHNSTPPPPHLPAEHCLYILYFDFGKGGGVGELNQREGEKGNSSQSCVENTNMTDCISSL
jgi:hypothetical protein